MPDGPGAFTRAILESLAFKYRYVIECLEELTGSEIYGEISKKVFEQARDAIREALGEAVGDIPEGLYPGDYLVPVGQKLAVARAWENAGTDPASIGMLEAHGTSTRVGDATELGALDEIFAHRRIPGAATVPVVVLARAGANGGLRREPGLTVPEAWVIGPL